MHLKFPPKAKTTLLPGTSTKVRKVAHTHDPICSLHRHLCPANRDDLRVTPFGLRCGKV